MPKELRSVAATAAGERLAGELAQRVNLAGSELGRMRFWTEKLLLGSGEDSVAFILARLAEEARSKRNPVAFCLWATKQPGLPWIPDHAWDNRKPKRKTGGVAAVGDLVNSWAS